MCLYEKPYIQPVVDLVEKWKFAQRTHRIAPGFRRTSAPSGKGEGHYVVDALGT